MNATVGIIWHVPPQMFSLVTTSHRKSSRVNWEPAFIIKRYLQRIFSCENVEEMLDIRIVDDDFFFIIRCVELYTKEFLVKYRVLTKTIIL